MALLILRNIGIAADSCFPKCYSVLPSKTSDIKPFGRCGQQFRMKFGAPKLTPQQVNVILRANEHNVDYHQTSSSVRCFDTNQLASNNPIEDRRAEARCQQTTGMLFGVFDGHGGPACAEVISKRLFTYIAASLLPIDMLNELVVALKCSEDVNLLEWHNNEESGNNQGETGFPPELDKLYKQSFNKFVEFLIQNGQCSKGEFQMRDVLTKVFQYLDKDLWREVESAEESRSPLLLAQTIAVAMSGAVACVAHIDGAHLHIASTGDCGAVLGTLSETNTWIAKPLTKLHSVENLCEVKRVLSEHPKNESETVLKNERLLGQLAPLRAFGDFRFKWPSSIQKRLLVPVYGHKVLPQGYYTPPYLTSRPDVTHHRLLPRDKFLVLASDGLWEQLSYTRVVQLVGEYMRGRQTLEPFRLAPAGGRQLRQPLTLGEIAEILVQRKEGLEHKPVDSNAATHLIRSALGGTEYGIDHSVLSQMLSAPEEVVRLIRDDITIIIVFFNSDYLRHTPA